MQHFGGSLPSRPRFAALNVDMPDSSGTEVCMALADPHKGSK